jgi:hypothetical protein
MLAAAFLTITAATEHARNPARAGDITLTRNEIACLLASLVTKPARGHPGTGCAGPAGGDTTSTAPRCPTTSGRKPKAHDHNDLRL